MQYLPCLLHNPDKSDRAVPYNLRKSIMLVKIMTLD